MLDFAGELNRFAVARATVRDMEAVQQCRDLVDGLMGQFLQVSSNQYAAVSPCGSGTPNPSGDDTSNNARVCSDQSLWPACSLILEMAHCGEAQ